jgi:hypothetical protein
MKKYAFVKPDNGEISYFIRIQTEYSYEEGSQPDGLICVQVSDDLSVVDEEDYIRTKYYKNDEWCDREDAPSPQELYKWVNEEWVFDNTDLWNQIKGTRTLRLNLTDWTQVADNNLTEEQRAGWRTYRQALRDITTTNQDIEVYDQVVWPTPPS